MDAKGSGGNEFYQASKRGGVVKVEVNHERVGLSGQAVTVWKGELID
jgi:predicted PhzF superfamily epimerase YddE/YHI9